MVKPSTLLQPSWRRRGSAVRNWRNPRKLDAGSHLLWGGRDRESGGEIRLTRIIPPFPPRSTKLGSFVKDFPGSAELSSWAPSPPRSRAPLQRLVWAELFARRTGRSLFCTEA